MTLFDAYDVLGLPQNSNDENLIKKRFKELTLKYHPDLGGTTEDMVRVNQAKDRIDNYIKNRAPSSYTPPNNKWDDRMNSYEKKRAEYREVILKTANLVKEILVNNSDIFLEYLAENTNHTKHPKMLLKETVLVENFLLEYKFKFEDMSDCSLIIRGNISSHSTSEPLVVLNYISEVYNQNLHYKMKKATGTTIPIDHINDPEEFFPRTKLKKIFSATPPQKQFRKTDAEKMVIKELGGKIWANNNWSIPVTHDPTRVIVIGRWVFQKTVTWRVVGLYEKGRIIAFLKEEPNKSYVFEETLGKTSDVYFSNFREFIDLLKKAQNNQVEWEFKFNKN